ncbi:MAG: AmmeMemoRadiSam system protein B [Myxococcota bacterium]
MQRLPAVAGRFYPDDPDDLAREVDRYIGPSPSDEPAIALIGPHAGYMYSGSIAGEVYASARVPDVVVVLAPNHAAVGARAAVQTTGHWHIPGAKVPIAENEAQTLQGLALLTEDPRAHAHEHSLEVHLPFLVRRNPDVRIVPVSLSFMPYAACARIGTALADLVTQHGRDVLIVASTDMSHYLPADVASSEDRLALDRIGALDPEGLYRTVVERDISMCGIIPTTVALVAAGALGAQTARLIRYGSSGDASGDYSRVVGYAGFVIR